MAGEGPGCGNDIVLDVLRSAAFTDGIEFLELASIILIGRDLQVGIAVEIDQHGGVEGDGPDELMKISEGIAAQGEVLGKPELGRDIAKMRGGVHGEMVVPE